MAGLAEDLAALKRGQEGRRERGWIGVGAQVAARAEACEQVSEEFLPCGERRLDLPLRSLVPASDLGRDPSDRAAGQALLVDCDEAVKLPLELGERVQPGEQAGQRLLYLRATAGDRRFDQGVTVSEVVVELTLARAGGGQDVIEAQALDAALGNEFRSALHDQVATLASATRLRLGPQGPAVEPGTELDGYYIYGAPDLDAAIAFAARIPVTRFGGTVEVRPMLER